MRFLLGNEIVAISAINNGIQVATSYPGTPSVDILETMLKHKEKLLHVEWSINEKVALEVAAGYAFSGVPAMCSMKSVGMNVASDALMTLAYTGVNAPLIVVVVDTPGCYSSQNEQDTRHYALMSHLPLLEPNSPADCADVMANAVNISKQLGIPVIIRLTTKIAHGRQSTDIKIKYRRPPKPLFKKDASRYVMIPRFALMQHRKLLEKHEAAKRMMPLKTHGSGNNCIIATGIAYANAIDVCNEMKIRCAFVEVKGLPFDEPKLKAQIKHYKNIFVFEEGAPILENIVKGLHPHVVGMGEKSGELGINGVYEALSGALKLPFKRKDEPKLPARSPRLCAGCPHMMSFYWLRKFDVIFPGDIGCYGLGYQWGCIDTVVCMGASIGIGQSLPGKRIIVVGDSTFYHAAMPALANAVEQKRDMVVAVLDNSTVAMTGNQPVPNLDIKAVSEALGAHAYVVDPASKSTKNVIEDALKSKGVHVIIFKKPCARISAREKPLAITDACTDCGICDGINCPAIEREPRRINLLCNGCGFCKALCPSGAMI